MAQGGVSKVEFLATMVQVGLVLYSDNNSWVTVAQFNRQWERHVGELLDADRLGFPNLTTFFEQMRATRLLRIIYVEDTMLFRARRTFWFKIANIAEHLFHDE